MFNFRRITLFCLEKRLPKHKMTIFSTNLGGRHGPFGSLLGNFLRTPLTGSDTSRFESVDSDKEGTSSDVRMLSHASKNTQNLDEQMILLLSQAL